MRNAPEVEQIWCPRTKSVSTAMFQRPNQVFELTIVPYSARSKQFDLLEWSLCDTPFEPVRYGSVRPGPEHPYRTFSRHRYDISLFMYDMRSAPSMYLFSHVCFFISIISILSFQLKNSFTHSCMFIVQHHGQTHL